MGSILLMKLMEIGLTPRVILQAESKEKPNKKETHRGKLGTKHLDKVRLAKS